MSKRTFFYINAPLSESREDLLNDGFQCFADIRQAANGLHACGFQRCEFLICRTFTTGNNRTCVTHTLTFRRGHTGAVAHNRLGHVFFDVRCRFFFRATAALTDHPVRFGRPTSLDRPPGMEEVRARARVTTDAHAGRPADTVAGSRLTRVVGHRTGPGDDAHFARLVNGAWHDADFAFGCGHY